MRKVNPTQFGLIAIFLPLIALASLDYFVLHWVITDFAGYRALASVLFAAFIILTVKAGKEA